MTNNFLFMKTLKTSLARFFVNENLVRSLDLKTSLTRLSELALRSWFKCIVFVSSPSWNFFETDWQIGTDWQKIFS